MAALPQRNPVPTTLRRGCDKKGGHFGGLHGERHAWYFEQAFVARIPLYFRGRGQIPLPPADAERSADLLLGCRDLVAHRRTQHIGNLRPDGRIGSPRALRGAPQSGAVGIVGAAGRITVAWGTSRGLRIATYTAPR